MTGKIPRPAQLLESLEPRKLLTVYTVDTAVDELDSNMAEGDFSLREAIVLANENPDSDTIRFADSLRGATLTLTMGELAIRSDLVITGTDPDGDDADITIDADNDSRLFRIDDGDSGSLSTVVLEYLTLTGGNSGGNDGGSIFATETLTIRDSVISGGTAGTGYGGAIYHAAVLGSLRLERTAVIGNSAQNGGGIYAVATTEVRIDSSELSQNTSQEFGGGLDINSVARVFVNSSTISSNTAGNEGGGISLANLGAETQIHNSTIAFNTAGTDDTDAGGGGISIVEGTIQLISTIVANNLRQSDTPSDIKAELGFINTDTSTHNLIGDASSAGGITNGTLNNIVGADAALLPLNGNGGTTRTHAIQNDSPAVNTGRNVDVAQWDQRGNGFSRTVAGDTDIGAFESQDSELDLEAFTDAQPLATSDTNDLHWVVVRNGDGDLIVFSGRDESFNAYRLRDRVDGPAATADPMVWTDPNNGLAYIGVPTEEGFVLYQRAENGEWSLRNLTDELGLGEDSPSDRLTQFVTRTGRVSLGGYTESGELVLLQQTGDFVNGIAQWEFRNLSDDLAAQSMTTPDLQEVISYVTPWDQWTIAGVDAEGDIQGVWVFTNSFEQWRVDNLSDLYDAPPIAGQLTVIITSWQAINLAGTDEDGHLVVTWWVPSFTQQGRGWAVTDLTTQFDGEPLAAGRVTGFVTPWGAMNYAGLDADGDVVAYWWTPSSPWRVSPLTNASDPSSDLPTGTLTNHVSSSGTMSILGSAADNHIVRLWWSTDSDGWTLTDLTEIAVRV